MVILGIATSPTTGYIYVVSSSSKSSFVYVVDPSNYQIVDTIHGVVSYARHIVITPNGQYAYVGGTGISVISLSNN